MSSIAAVPTVLPVGYAPPSTLVCSSLCVDTRAQALVGGRGALTEPFALPSA